MRTDKDEKRGRPAKKVEVDPMTAVKAYIQANYNTGKAAKTLGISRTDFYRKVSKSEEFNILLDNYNDILGGLFSEGLLSQDLNIRAKYLAMIPKAVLDEVLSRTELDGAENVVEIV
jgi:hypothetical protein